MNTFGIIFFVIFHVNNNIIDKFHFFSVSEFFRTSSFNEKKLYKYCIRIFESYFPVWETIAIKYEEIFHASQLVLIL